MKKNGRLKIFVALAVMIAVLFGVIGGAYLIVDKVVVPKYLSSYGINNLNELVTLVRTMYNNPKETEFIENPYAEADKISAFNKLKNAGFPVSENVSVIDYNAIAKADFVLTAGSGTMLTLTDKEIASILADVLKSGAIESNLASVSSFDTITMDAKEVIITPKLLNGVVNPKSANISLTIKVDTTKVREDMAKKMDMPLFLLNMIVPQNLYFACSFDINQKEDNIFEYSNCIMQINGTNEKQSEVLIDLLINFIFEKDENMTKYKLTIELGNIVIYGLELLGNFEFAGNLGASNNQNGLVVYLG